MEKFDMQDLIAAFDKAGKNHLITININALEISAQELILMLEQAEDIFQAGGDSVRIMACVMGDGDYLAALVDENEMIVAC